MHEMTFIMWV